jgi:hypothetical protein
MPTPPEVMQSMLANLYQILTDVPEGFPERDERDKFITWCSPGIPIDGDDLRFTRRGLIGEGTAEARGADTALLLQQAASFARLVDYVPDVSGIYDGNARLSQVMEKVLAQSQVAATELTEEEKAKLEQFRAAMYAEQDVTDPDTGVTTKQSVEAPKLKAYKKFQKLYNDAFTTYNTLRIKAMVAANAEDVIRFATEEPIYRQQVTSAMAEWEAQGFKSEIEGMQAYITQVTGRDLTLWKADVVDRFEKSKLSLPTGETFYFSSLVPASFVDDDSGWTKYKFTDKETEQFSSSKATQWDVGGGWKSAFSFGGDASGSTTTKHDLSSVTNFSMSFEIAQVLISQAWLDTAFLSSTSWKLADNALDVSELSDGGLPPKGMLIGYPTMAIFIRNVVMDFSELHDETNEVNKTFKAGGSGGWGPIKLGGNYSTASGEKKVTSTLTERGLEVPGMQFVAARVKLLEKMPNPNAAITKFV